MLYWQWPPLVPTTSIQFTLLQTTWDAPTLEWVFYGQPEFPRHRLQRGLEKRPRPAIHGPGSKHQGIASQNMKLAPHQVAFSPTKHFEIRYWDTDFVGSVLWGPDRLQSVRFHVRNYSADVCPPRKLPTGANFKKILWDTLQPSLLAIWCS